MSGPGSSVACAGCAACAGWGRVAYWLVPDSLDGEFLIRNDRLLFAGTFRSYIDRQTYLFGQYEDEAISLFLQLLAERAGSGRFSTSARMSALTVSRSHSASSRCMRSNRTRICGARLNAI